VSGNPLAGRASAVPALAERHAPVWSKLLTLRNLCTTKEVFLGECWRLLRRQVSIVQDDGEEGTMDAQTAIVVDEAQLSELIQKETHPGPGGATVCGLLHVALAFDVALIRVDLPAVRGWGRAGQRSWRTEAPTRSRPAALRLG
jgi:hypothetical protein